MLLVATCCTEFFLAADIQLKVVICNVAAQKSEMVKVQDFDVNNDVVLMVLSIKSLSCHGHDKQISIETGSGTWYKQG
jgi:hypothetical protein